jgi:hypothetical protein
VLAVLAGAIIRKTADPLQPAASLLLTAVFKIKIRYHAASAEREQERTVLLHGKMLLGVRVM